MPPSTQLRAIGVRIRSVVLGGALLAGALSGGAYDVVVRAEWFALAAWTLALGLALGMLPRGSLTVPLRVSLVAFLALTAWTATSLLWTESSGRTVLELARVAGLTAILALVVTTFKARDGAAPAAALAIVGAVVCVLGLTSRLYPHIIESQLPAVGYEFRRLSHPLNYWNAVGVWSSMTIGLTLAWAAHARRWWVGGAALGAVSIAAVTAYLTYSRTAAFTAPVAIVAATVLARNRWATAIYAVLAAGGAGAVILAIRGHQPIVTGRGTEGASEVTLTLVAVVAAAFVLAFLVRHTPVQRARMSRRPARVALAAFVVALLVSGAVAGPSLAERAWESFERTGHRDDARDPAKRLIGFGGGRKVVFDIALDTFSAHPVEGTGAGTFEFDHNRDQRRLERLRDAHSLYLEMLAELGLPGGILVVVAILALAVAAVVAPFRHADAQQAGAAAGGATALIVFSVGAGFDWMWESTAVTVYALAAGGVAAVSVARSRRVAVGRPVRIAGAVLGLLVVALQIPGLLQTRQIRESQDAVRALRLPAAVTAADTAVDIAPWDAAGYLQRAQVLELSGLQRQAFADARRATELEPANWETWLVLARIEARRGRAQAALDALRRARRNNPRAPVFERIRGS